MNGIMVPVSDDQFFLQIMADQIKIRYQNRYIKMKNCFYFYTSNEY